MACPPLAFCRFAVAAALCWLPATHPAAGPQLSANQVEFFESRVRPVLAGTCLKCHGVSTHKGGLRLDSRDAVLKGGDSGAAVVPGNPDASPMIDAINYRGLEMPPTGKLNPREIAALVEWVKMGAPWPKDDGNSGWPVARSNSRSQTRTASIGRFSRSDIPRSRRSVRAELGGQSDRRLCARPPRRKGAGARIRRPIPARSSAGCFSISSDCRPRPKRSTRFVADHSPQAY